MYFKNDLLNWIYDNMKSIKTVGDFINKLEVEVNTNNYANKIKLNINKIISDYKQDLNWDLTVIDLNNYLFN